MAPTVFGPTDTEGDPVADEKSSWYKAERWRKTATQELASISLTFTQWLVLDAARELIEETQDATSQSAIATRAELSPMTVSHTMNALDQRGLVSREPCFGRPAYRVWLTSKGEALVVKGHACVKAACLRLRDETR